MAVMSRREWLSKTGIGAGIGAAAFTFAPGMFVPKLLAEEPRVADHSKISDADEIELGKQFGAQLEKEEPIATNGIIDSYLTSIVRQLAAKSQRPNMPYYIKLVNSMDVNACSIPGGGLYLNRGLLELSTSEDQLVATLAHEIGHVVGRHSINQLLLSFQAKALLKPVLDNLHKNNGVVQQIILRLGGAVGMLAMLHFSREDEAQADLLGFYEMLRAGWDPHGFVKLFELLERVEKAAGGTPVPFLSDHPPTPARMAAIQKELHSVSIPSDAKTDSVSFHACKAAMRFLPAPPPKKARSKG
jgi:beta-barrel assembly-enhancing protease